MHDNSLALSVLVSELTNFAGRMKKPRGASERFIKNCPISLLQILADTDDDAPAVLTAITMRAWETRSASVTCTEDDLASWTGCVQVRCVMELLIREGMMSLDTCPETIFEDLPGQKVLCIRMTDKGMAEHARMESDFLSGTLPQETADMIRRSKVRGI